MRRRIVQGLVVVASTLGIVYATTVVTGDPTYSPTATLAPAVTGTPEIGQELSCTPGTWKRRPTQYAIKWENAATSAEVATGSPYVVSAGDEGDELRCRVTAANARGSGQSTSSAVGPIAAANPLLIVSDSLTDSDDTNLSAHVGEKGATWTKHPSLTRDTFITANRARGDGDTGRARYYASGVPASANYSVETALYWQSAGVTNQLEAIWGRLSTSVDTGYQARWSQTAAGYELVKVVTGTATRLGSVYTSSPATGETHTLKLEMLGPSLKMYVDDVVRVSVTDAAITAAGRAGIGTRTSTATTGIHIDSVQATLVSPSAPLCANGLDDDSDTFFDFPADVDCSDANDNDETAAAPPDPLCDDGIDNDSPTDGLIDFPADPGCDDALDNDEYNEPPPPPGDEAANVFISATGSDVGVNCAYFSAPVSPPSAATVCATADKASSLIPRAGDATVYVLSGTYEHLKLTSECFTDYVTFEPSPDAAVTVDGAGAGANDFNGAWELLGSISGATTGNCYLRIRAFEMFDRFWIDRNNHHIEILDNWVHSKDSPPDVNSGSVNVTSAGVVTRCSGSNCVNGQYNFTIRGNHFEGIAYNCLGTGSDVNACDSNDNDGIGVGYCIQTNYAGTGFVIGANHLDGCWEDGMLLPPHPALLIEDNLFNDIGGGATEHSDGIQIFNPVTHEGATIRRNVFSGLHSTCMRIQDGIRNDYLVENNVCGTSGAGRCYEFEEMHDFIFRHNTCGDTQHGTVIGDDAPVPGVNDNVVIENNIFGGSLTSCSLDFGGTNITYRYNILTEPCTTGQAALANCTPGCSTTGPTYIDAVLGADMRLASGSAGVNAGVASVVALDALSRLRPISTPDIGAYERQTDDP